MEKRTDQLLRRAYNSVQKRFFKNAQDRIFDRWFADRGDQTLRLDYDLKPESLVVDLGGYKGDWAADIYSRYRCRILVFEPVAGFANEIKQRFNGNSKIQVFAFGLGERSERSILHMGDNASSQFSSSGVQSQSANAESIEIEIRRFADFVKEQNIDNIDLLKINIEGAEFGLLEHIIEADWASHIKDLQIQFHSFVPGSVDRRERIRIGLSRTHHTTYDYPFVWENWRRDQ